MEPLGQSKLGEADQVRSTLVHAHITGVIHELGLGQDPPVDRLILTLDKNQQVIIESERLILRFGE